MFKIRLVGFVLATLFAVPAWAAAVIFHVTNNADSGTGTLRQAILDGNNLPTNDFPDIYIDLGENDPIQLQSFLPIITDTIVHIRGTQATPAVINGLSQHSILRVNSGSASLVQLEHLVLRAGRSQHGGCLLLSDYNGWFLIDDVYFDGCSARGGTQALGGAIYAHGGTLVISNSQFRGNVAEAEYAAGGTIYQSGYDSRTAESSLTIRNCQFDTNSAITTEPAGFARGGAVAAWVTKLSVEDSLFHANWATSSDGQTNNSGGAINAAVSSVTVWRSNFSFNRAGHGGAIALKQGLDGNIESGMLLVNNTFVGNRADASGGAVAVSRADTVLRNNSFFANEAGLGGNNFDGRHQTSASVLPTYDFWNNLFTNQFPGSSCSNSLDVTTSGFNIIPGDGCGLENESSNRVTSDVHLQGYLLDADWPFDTTATPLRFFVDSAALDTGNPDLPDDDVVAACPELDGQGNARPVDGDAGGVARCDIGAFEWQHEASLFADDFEDRL